MNGSQKFNERLRDWRKYYRLTSGQLSSYTGVPENVLIALEQGRLKPDVQTAGRLNQFFTANLKNPDNLKSQYYQPNQHYSYPGMPPSNSYPTMRPPVESYPENYKGSPYQPQQGYSRPYSSPAAQSYGQVYVPTQQIHHPSVYQTQTAYQNQVYQPQPQYVYQNANNSGVSGVANRSKAKSGIVVKILMFLVFILPFVFQFAPFVSMIFSRTSSGALQSSGVLSGYNMFIFDMNIFTAYALIVQIGLWITTIAGGIMVIMAFLRLCGCDEKTFTIRTVLYYLYLVGAVFVVVGMIMALDRTRWGLAVYAACVILAVIVRIVTDGGASSFKMKK